MPRVPTYDGPQVQEQATQGGYQQTIDVTKGARALAAGLSDVAQVADTIDYRDSQAAAFKAEATIREEWQVQQAALRNQYKKDNADQYKTAADEWWAKARESYTSTLSPRAQALAGKSIGQYKLAQDADTMGYVSREKTAAREINFKTLQTSMTREALQTATPETASAIGALTGKQITENAIRYAAAEGLDSKVGEAMAREQVDLMHKSMALSLAGRQDGLAAAQAYLAENGKDMLPADRDAVLKQVEVTAKVASREREEKASDSAWQLVGKNKRVPEDVLSQMDGKERVQLQDHLRAKYERAVTGAAPKTDPKDHARLVDMMLNDPEAFKKERIAAAKLSPTDLEQFAAKQQALRGGGEKQDTMLTDDQRVTGALTAAGIDSKKKPELAYTVRSEIDRRVRAESTAKGGKLLTGDEKQRVVDSVLMDKVYVSEWGSDPQKPLSTLTADELGKAYVQLPGSKGMYGTTGVRNVLLSSVPSDKRAAIITGLRKAGQVVTEQAIVEIYDAKYGVKGK